MGLRSRRKSGLRAYAGEGVSTSSASFVSWVGTIQRRKARSAFCIVVWRFERTGVWSSESLVIVYVALCRPKRRNLYKGQTSAESISRYHPRYGEVVKPDTLSLVCLLGNIFHLYFD